ncbi:MAG TPA: GxxExxY protein [Gammaproteobacteria bacterium]
MNEITGAVVDAAMKVHSKLGPGLLESAYEACISYELNERRISVKTQVSLPVRYEQKLIDVGYRIDMLVEDMVIVELKAVEKLLPIHKAQLLSYLRLSNKRVGLLLNFNEVHMRNGVKRIVNNYGDQAD